MRGVGEGEKPYKFMKLKLNTPRHPQGLQLFQSLSCATRRRLLQDECQPSPASDVFTNYVDSVVYERASAVAQRLDSAECNDWPQSSGTRVSYGNIKRPKRMKAKDVKSLCYIRRLQRSRL